MRYDITFIGHLCYDEVIHYDGSQSTCAGGAALYGTMAAASLGKRVAAAIMCTPQDRADLDLLTQNGIEVYPIDSPATTRVQVVHKSTNMDERDIRTQQYAGVFTIHSVPRIETKHIHLAGCNDHEFSVDFIQALTEWGIPLSVDMQSFVRCNDSETGQIVCRDDPDKQEVASLMDKIKLDIVEAKLLTGTDDLEKAAAIIRGWGCPEIVITSTDGVLACDREQSHFATFTNRSSAGRTGRGDTTFGAYLAARLDHEIPEALEWAAALVSIKMETPGPVNGTMDDVRKRMGKDRC